MKKTLFVFLFCGILLLTLSGCSKNSSDTTNQSENENRNTSKINIDNVSNSELATVVANYLQALYIDNDSKTAYSYIDFFGVLTWRKLNYNYITHITEEQANLFVTKYKEFHTIQNEENVKKFILEKLTDEYYTNTDSELPTKDTTMTIKDTTEFVEDLWKVEVYQEDSFQISTYYYLLYRDDEYKFVDLNSLYVTSLVNEMDYLNI